MQRTFLGFVICFLGGLAVGYGLAYLDHQASVPRLELDRTEIFELAFPDGTSERLSYTDVERERTELKHLRRRLVSLEEKRLSSPSLPPRKAPKTSGQSAETSGTSPGEASAAPSSRLPETSKKKLGDLFAKIFSKPVMQEIVRSQVKRQAGELSAVLDLSDEQRKTLEAELAKRKREHALNRGRPAAGPMNSARESQDLEDLYRTVFSPEQLRRYEEYTEKKKELAGAPPTDRELFELTWRLDLNEEQETKAGEVLKAQWKTIQQLSPVAGPDSETSPLDQFNQYLEKRKETISRSTEQLKTFLEEDQIAGYLQYLQDKDTETKLLQKMIRSESSEGPEHRP